MNYLSGALRYVKGAETEQQNIVPRLIDRIKTSALPHDRRNAIIQLTDTAKESPQRQSQIGELSLKVVYAILEQDTDFEETVKATLELLIAICGTLDYPSSTASDQKATLSREQFEHETRDAAATNIDVYLGLPNSLPLLLQLLDRNEFYIKYGTIELLAAMAANSRQTLQAAVLEAPQGVARICDVLEDSHRHIRSSAVLLISTLCDQSPEICKIVVFGAVLEKLFALIESVASDSRTNQPMESADDDDDDNTVETAIIVQDALITVRTLIHGTSSTKTFFRDSGCVSRLLSVLQQSMDDAGFRQSDPSMESESSSTGMRSAIQLQTRKNITIAMQCVSGLVDGSDEPARLIKNDLADSDLSNLLSTVAFTSSSNLSTASANQTSLLQIRVTALKTMSKLLRGHDGFRAKFSTTHTLPGRSDMMNAQITTLRSMLSDPSAAVRIAAYSVLCDSFVVDTGLDLPSSALLNAMTNSSSSASFSLSNSRNLSHGFLSSSTDVSTITDTVSYVVEAIKEGLIGWPTNSDAAGVFYSALFTSWILTNGDNAKERLLNTYANGSALLPQLIRILGKLEREKGPAEVRISLFSLACVWLYDCPAAVSSFLSSAMHLPMLVDILKTDSVRGDVADVHVRGLAAVLLGICFKVTETASGDSVSNSVFLSGGGSSSIIPRGAVADVIRNRIGVTWFTSCLDDLRATRAFSTLPGKSGLWGTVDDVLSREHREGLLSSSGHLGHENWYQPMVVTVVDEVYKHIGARAMDLIAEPQLRQGMNGHMSAPLPKSTGDDEDYSDSARDEVLKSYKEFIRTQDENMNAARGQIEELSAALREAQVELDAKANSMSSDTFLQLKSERDELTQHKDVLEALLSEKTSDYDDALRTLAAYEDEQTSGAEVSSNVGSGGTGVELETLRSQTAAMSTALDSEMHRRMESSRRIALLEDTIHRKDIEIEAIAKEAEAIKDNVQPDAAEALHWRSRAEIAEYSVQSQEETINKFQESESEFLTRLHTTERSRDDALAELESRTRLANDSKLELDKVRSTRQRELEASRNSSTTEAAAHDEIEFLKAQLCEAQELILDQERQLSAQPQSNDENMERLQSNYSAILQSSEGLKNNLTDSKEAKSKWQKRAEVSEDLRDKQAAEISRLAVSCEELEEKVKSLTEALGKQEQTSSASKILVSELEQQCTELDELRRHGEDNLLELRKELSMRTEQSIRLSGQIYEIEEQKTIMEEQVDSLRESVRSRGGEVDSENDQASREVSLSESGMRQELQALKQELESANEALAESRVKESLISGDHKLLLSRAETAEATSSKNQNLLQKMTEEMNDMNDRLLSVDEAEHAKRALTMQVVELQQQLDQQTIRSDQADLLAQAEKSSFLKSEVVRLQSLLDDKIREFESTSSSLKNSKENLVSSEIIISDLEKQVAESDTIFSVLRSERDNLLKDASELREKVDRFSSLEQDFLYIEELKNEREESEKKALELSEKLISINKENKKNADEAQATIRSFSDEVEKLQAELKKLKGEQDDLISTIQSMEFKLIENQSIIDDKCDQEDMLGEALRESKNNENELSGKIQVIEAELDSKYVDIESRSEDIKKLEKEAEEQKDTYAKLETEKAQVENENIQFKRETEESKLGLEQLKGKLTWVETSRDELAGKIFEMENKISEGESAVAVKTNQLEELKAELGQSKNSRDELFETIKAVEQKCNEYETAAANKTMEIELLKAEVSEAQKKSDAMGQNERTFDEKCREYERDIESQTMEIELLKGEISESEKLRTQIGHNVSMFEQRCKEYEGDIEAMTMELELLKGNLSESKRIQDEQENQIKAMEGKYEGMEHRNVTMEQKFNEYETVIEAKGKEVEALQGGMSDWVKNRETNDLESESKAKEIEGLKTEISKLENTREELAAKLTSLTVIQELTEIETKVSAESNARKVGQLQSEVKELQKNCSQLSKELTSSEEAAKLKINEWRGVAELQVQSLEEVRNNLELSESRCASLQEELQELNETLDSKENEMQNMVQAHRVEVEELVKTKDCLSSQLSSALDVSKQREMDDQLVTEAHASEVELLRNQIGKSEEDVKSLMEKITALTRSITENETGKMHLKSKLRESEQKALDLSSEFAVVGDVCKSAEEEANKLREENKLARSKANTAEEKSKNYEFNFGQQMRTKEVENVIESIILNAAYSSTVNSLSTQLDRANRQLDVTRMSLTEQKCRAESFEKQVEQMQVLRSNCEEAQQLCATQKERLSQLFGELAGMQIISNERDQVKSDLETAETKIQEGEQQRDAAVEALALSQSLSGGDDVRSQRSTPPADEASDDTHINSTHSSTQQKHRVKELEDALRDAARTVAATNKELIAAQALLVEISSDKTAMRATLGDAEQQIQVLKHNQVCKKCNILVSSGQHSIIVPNDTGELSEALEPEENNATDGCTSGGDDDDDRPLAMELKITRIEAGNLQTALSRSVAEANSASTLVSEITEKVNSIETLLKSSRSKEEAMRNDLSESEAGRQQLKLELESAKRTHSHLIDTHAVEVESVTKKAEDDVQVLKAEICKLDAIIEDLKQQRDRMSTQFDNLGVQLDDSKEKLESVESAAVILHDGRKDMENRWRDVRTRLVASERQQSELEKLLSCRENEMREQKQLHDQVMEVSREKWNVEVKGYEQEIERVSTELEDAERGLRGREGELKSEQARYLKERSELRERLDRSEESVREMTQISNEHEDRAVQLTADLEKHGKKHASQLQEAMNVQQLLRSEVNAVKAERDRIQLDLASSETELSYLKQELSEDRDKRRMLEEENQEFVRSTEWLEKQCKGLDEDVKAVKRANERVERMKGNVERKLEAEMQSAKALQGTIKETEGALKKMTSDRELAFGEVADLKTKIEEKIAECEQLGRDNADLREWVTDLERQANQLQTAASDFEEVEQNLQESLEAQRRAMEQVNKLTEELKRERESARLAEGRRRKSEREREAAEVALRGCEETLHGVERRLADIRESSVRKISAAEGSVRSQAQRCIELETSLAEAQRQVAELGQASDEVFAVNAELRRSKDELVRMKDQSEEAERKVEEVEVDLRRCREETEELKASAGGEGMKALEAEHNELLVYLADLELELTSLKDSADHVS